MQTAETIMQNLEQKVSNNEPISPAYWLEAALRVNQLASVLDNQLAHLEAEMNNIEATLIEKDMPATKAKVLARSKVDYEKYLKTKAILKRVENFMSTARRRAQIIEQ